MSGSRRGKIDELKSRLKDAVGNIEGIESTETVNATKSQIDKGSGRG